MEHYGVSRRRGKLERQSSSSILNLGHQVSDTSLAVRVRKKLGSLYSFTRGRRSASLLLWHDVLKYTDTMGRSAEGVKMFSISRRLGPALLRRSTATAATANKAHADPATWAVNYNPQERDRIDNNINANRDLIHENHKYMNERFDDHRQQMDGKLDEKLKHVDTKLDSALEKFIKSNDSLKVSFTELRDELSKMKAETKDELSKMKAETKEDFHKLDKSVTLVSRSAALLASAISLGLTFA
ncbi:hypothetical protein Ndes2526A_g04429 [Nannochloris sp. 'desiccata']